MDTCTAIDPTAKIATCLSGKQYEFDFCLCASGVINQYPGSAPPGDVVKVKTQMDTRRRLLQNCKTAVIAGGGAVGLELAGEIKADYPDTDVTIVHPYKKLLGKDQSHLFSDDFLNTIKNNMDAVGIKYVLGERVELPSPFPEMGLEVRDETAPVVTDKGRKLACDLLVCCVGNRPSPGPFKDFMSSALDEWGFVHVKDTLQVEGFPEIFAVGDCTSRDEPKTAANAQAGAEVAVENMIKLAERKFAAEEDAGGDIESKQGPSEPLRELPPGAAAMSMILSQGRGKGAMQSSDGNVEGSEVVGKIKSNTMYAAKMWKMFGIDDPNAALQSSSRKTVVGLEASEMWNAVQKEAEEA